MNRTAWIVFAVMLALLVALSVKKYALPRLVNGGEVSPARTPVPAAGPPRVQSPMFAPVPITAARAQGVNQQQEAAALQKLRERMELERHLSGDPTPRVDTITVTPDNRLCVLIGDALVPEGGTVQGYRVRRITADSVEFEKDGKTWVQKVD
jgi:hypothetical protein